MREEIRQLAIEFEAETCRTKWGIGVEDGDCAGHLPDGLCTTCLADQITKLVVERVREMGCPHECQCVDINWGSVMLDDCILRRLQDKEYHAVEHFRTALLAELES